MTNQLNNSLWLKKFLEENHEELLLHSTCIFSLFPDELHTEGLLQRVRLNCNGFSLPLAISVIQ